MRDAGLILSTLGAFRGSEQGPTGLGVGLRTGAGGWLWITFSAPDPVPSGLKPHCGPGTCPFPSPIRKTLSPGRGPSSRRAPLCVLSSSTLPLPPQKGPEMVPGSPPVEPWGCGPLHRAGTKLGLNTQGSGPLEGLPLPHVSAHCSVQPAPLVTWDSACPQQRTGPRGRERGDVREDSEPSSQMPRGPALSWWFLKKLSKSTCARRLRRQDRKSRAPVRPVLRRGAPHVPPGGQHGMPVAGRPPQLVAVVTGTSRGTSGWRDVRAAEFFGLPAEASVSPSTQPSAGHSRPPSSFRPLCPRGARRGDRP